MLTVIYDYRDVEYGETMNDHFTDSRTAPATPAEFARKAFRREGEAPGCMLALLIAAAFAATLLLVAGTGNISSAEGEQTCGPNLTWELNGTDLTITGEGAMTDYGDTGGPWGSNITNVILPDGITSIGSYAFKGCSGLTSVNIPGSVISIGDFAFEGCTSLNTVFYNALGLDTTKACWPSASILFIDANGGYAAGGAMTDGKLPSTEGFVPPAGKAFKAYSTEKDGTGTSLMPGDEYKLEGRQIVYAIWAPIQYSVTGDIGGGSVDITAVEYHQALLITIIPMEGHFLPETVTMTMGGSGFTDFTYSKDDGTITIAENVIEGDLTVTADCPLWTPTVTFDANGGNPTGMTEVTGTEGKIAGFPDNPTMDGYLFAGWYTSASGGTRIDLDTVFTEDTTVYAHWTVAMATVTFKPSPGGSASVSSIWIPPNSSINVSDDTIWFGENPAMYHVKAIPDEGYYFISWSVTEGTVTSDMTIELTFKAINGITVLKAPKSEYTVGESFDPTGLIIILTFADKTYKTVGYEGHESEFSFPNPLGTPLKTTDKNVTVSFGGNSVTLDVTVAKSSPIDTDVALWIAGVAIVLILSAVMLIWVTRA